MAKFILWSPKETPTGVTFLATSISIHKIGNGTEAMIDDMLKDMGVVGVQVSSWSIQSYLCDYLQDADAVVWEDIWSPTWQIKVEFKEKKKLQFVIDDDQLFRSSAGDHSMPTNEQTTSIKALLVLDFHDQDYDDLFADHLHELRVALEEEMTKEDILDQFGDPEEQEHYYQLCSNYSSFKSMLRSEDFMTVAYRKNKKIHIDLGKLDLTFFQALHPFLEALKNIAKVFNATSNWDDHVHYNVTHE